MSNVIRGTFPIGLHWQMFDPFLFCAHHLDEYPRGNGQLAPAATLEGRNIGSDFEPKDGWRMYHGDSVPGFPQHPHRGFETITYVRQGLIDHSDSLGAAARFGRGDVQWLTAGGGIVHSEMFPLVNEEDDNTTELFQIWLNLPAEDKMVDPYFTMSWDHDIPKVVVTAEGEPQLRITVVAGALDGATPVDPPPNSWAARPESDIAIWHLEFEPGATWSLPKAQFANTNRGLYIFNGDGLEINGSYVEAGAAAVLEPKAATTVTATKGVTSALLVQGRPIGEPVAQYGPFVMNDRQGIEQAIMDYNRTGFGGWPWDANGPTHGPAEVRFARYPDGREEYPHELSQSR